MRNAGLTLGLLLAMGAPAAAQQAGAPCPPPRSLAAQADTAKPDISITARVQAAELRFNAQPQTSLQLFGCPQVDTSRVVVRSNLPTPVQPGVTYSNVRVDFRLNMKFAELECLLAGRICPARDTTRVR